MRPILNLTTICPKRFAVNPLFRSVLFWSHLAAGVVAGVVILMMSATGTVLMYEAQILEWRERSYFVDAGPETPRLGTDELVAAAVTHGAAEYGPEFEATSLIMARDPRAAVQVRSGRDRIYVSPVDGAFLGTGFPKTQAFLSDVRGWHRWFNMQGDARGTGRSITGAANLLFLFILLTGAILWIPRKATWRHLKAVLFFRRGLSGKARDFNWHNVMGVWTLVPMILIVVSGAVISYRWAGNMVYRAVGEAPPVRGASAPAEEMPPEVLAALPTPDVEAGIRTAMERMPDWRTLSVTLPGEGETETRVRAYEGYRGQPQLSATLMAAADGSEVSWTTFDDGTTGRKARSFLRFAHTGEYWGLWGQTIFGLVSLAGVFLVWTGISLTLRRLARSIRRRDGGEHEVGATADETSSIPEEARLPVAAFEGSAS